MYSKNPSKTMIVTLLDKIFCCCYDQSTPSTIFIVFRFINNKLQIFFAQTYPPSQTIKAGV